MKSSVCAVIVTYHPDLNLKRALALLQPQVQWIVLVDNHSTRDELAWIRVIAVEHEAHLIENSENYGIGTALNQGVRWASEKEGCEFVLFFDQDSYVSPEFVAESIATYEIGSEKMRIVATTPRIVNRESGKSEPPVTFGGRMLVAQTSGSLMPIAQFSGGNMYREDLFIDYVDYEYCLRMVSAGWDLAYCPTAVLYHQPGNIIYKRLLGRTIATYNYSGLRQYYLLRNGLWTVWKYRSISSWSRYEASRILTGFARVLLLEPNRWTNTKMWTLALADLLRGRLGKCSYR
jgi:rhamnosyltransferase